MKHHVDTALIGARSAATTRRNVYLTRDIIAEVEAEARRQCCSFSRVLRLAWQEAREGLRRYPTVEGGGGDDQ